MKRPLAAVALCAGLLSAAADAAIMTFTNRAAFLAATGASSIGAIPATIAGSGFTLGPLTFTNHAPSTMTSGVNWSTLISEPFDLAVSNIESFNIAASGPLFAFGFDFHEPTLSTPPGPAFPDTCNTACVDSTFRITLFNGAIVVDSFDFNADDDVLAFIGVSSTLSFDRIEIRETVGTSDNEFFGNFLVGRVQLVPEPATLVLVGVGLLGLAATRRRRPR